MGLKEAHERACREQGMTEEQIARDWEAFEAEYNAWLDETRARERAEDEDAEVNPREQARRCVAAARDIGLMESYAESCEGLRYQCPECPFRRGK